MLLAQILLFKIGIRGKGVGTGRVFSIPVDVSLTYLPTLGLSKKQEKRSVIFLKSRFPLAYASGSRDFYHE